jgi:hypothetical protein
MYATQLPSGAGTIAAKGGPGPKLIDPRDNGIANWTVARRRDDPLRRGIGAVYQEGRVPRSQTLKSDVCASRETAVTLGTHFCLLISSHLPDTLSLAEQF